MIRREVPSHWHQITEMRIKGESFESIADKFDRHPGTIQRICSLMGAGHHHKMVNEAKKWEIFDAYLNGDRVADLAKEYELVPSRIYQILREMNKKLPKRPAHA